MSFRGTMRNCPIGFLTQKSPRSHPNETATRLSASAPAPVQAQVTQPPEMSRPDTVHVPADPVSALVGNGDGLEAEHVAARPSGPPVPLATRTAAPKAHATPVNMNNPAAFRVGAGQEPICRPVVTLPYDTVPDIGHDASTIEKRWIKRVRPKLKS